MQAPFITYVLGLWIKMLYTKASPHVIITSTKLANDEKDQ